MQKDLKKLNRRELVDIIYQMKKNEQELQAEIVTLQKALAEKRIRLSQAGSIAEAAVSLTDLFSSAQDAADLYLNEIDCIKQKTEKECAEKLEMTNEKVAKILSSAEEKYAQLRARYREDYQKWKRLRAEIQRLQKLK